MIFFLLFFLPRKITTNTIIFDFYKIYINVDALPTSIIFSIPTYLYLFKTQDLGEKFNSSITTNTGLTI